MRIAATLYHTAIDLEKNENGEQRTDREQKIQLQRPLLSPEDHRGERANKRGMLMWYQLEQQLVTFGPCEYSPCFSVLLRLNVKPGLQNRECYYAFSQLRGGWVIAEYKCYEITSTSLSARAAIEFSLNMDTTTI